jgi:hypothetical protein
MDLSIDRSTILRNCDTDCEAWDDDLNETSIGKLTNGVKRSVGVERGHTSRITHSFRASSADDESILSYNPWSKVSLP